MRNGRNLLAAFTALAGIVVFSVVCRGQRLMSPIVVPFEPARSPYIVIRVPVASGPCEAMLFDTGANTTLLASAFAARIGLSVGSARALESLNGSTAARTREVQGISFDGVPPAGARIAAATDLSGLPCLGHTIVGVYGHNWLMDVDYLIDYVGKRIVLGAPGALPPSVGGHRAVLSWVEGLPAVRAEVRGQRGESFSARFVLDSGTDHVTLFGRAAERMLVDGRTQTVMVDSGFGRRELPTARIVLNLDGRARPTRAVLMSDVRDREEDGLVPTSLFRSVFVSSADGIVNFDASLSQPNSKMRTSTCEATAPARQ